MKDKNRLQAMIDISLDKFKSEKGRRKEEHFVNYVVSVREYISFFGEDEWLKKVRRDYVDYCLRSEKE